MFPLGLPLAPFLPERQVGQLILLRWGRVLLYAQRWIAEQAEHFAYLMPNAIRKVLDIFLAFKEPGASGLEPKVDKILQNYHGLDAARVKAMERLAQLESHSESIGDVTTFSAYTLTQVADAAKCLLDLIAVVDPSHKKAMDKLCQ